VRLAWLLLAILLGSSAVAAQEKKKPHAKKPAGKTPAAHSRASPEQIRRFNELQKKPPPESKH
jgi:hypothetical protein